MSGKNSVKGGANAKAPAASSSLPKDQQNVDQSISGNSGAGDSNQPTPGTDANAGGADAGATANQNANAGTGTATEAATAGVAEAQRKQQEADALAEQQPKADEATALALAAQQNQPKKEIPALFITSRGDSFRRCGFRFGKEPLGIALECLTEQQIEQLKNEPNLIVEEGEALLDDLHVSEAQ